MYGFLAVKARVPNKTIFEDHKFYWIRLSMIKMREHPVRVGHDGRLNTPDGGSGVLLFVVGPVANISVSDTEQRRFLHFVREESI